MYIFIIKRAGEILFPKWHLSLKHNASDFPCIILFSDALNAIRNVTMSRLICDNTNIEQIQGDAFIAPSDT